MTYCEDRGTTISARPSYDFCQSVYAALKANNRGTLRFLCLGKNAATGCSFNHLHTDTTNNPHFCTTTSRVMRYSESSTKSSFFTMSARLRVSRLPLEAESSVATSWTPPREVDKAFQSRSDFTDRADTVNGLWRKCILLRGTSMTV